MIAKGAIIETLVKTTFIIILVFALLNLIVSSLIYYSSKRKLYLRASFFWAALIVNFLVQASAQNGETAIIMGYAFAIIPLNLLCHASVFFVNTKYPWKVMTSIGAFCVCLSYGLIHYDIGNFLIKSLPLAVATAAPLLYVTQLFIIKKRKEVTSLMKCHALVLFTLAIHCFNFSFFRNNPEAQLWGWPVSYAVYQLLAAIIPAMSLDFYHRQEKERLTEIIDERTKELNDSNKFLRTAVKEKDFLFKTLVHDVSNPLSVIQSRVKLFQMNKNVDKFVTTVDSMSKRISSLISQVRAFEKAMSEDGKIKVEEIDLYASMTDIIDMFEDKLSKKNVTIDYNASDFQDVLIYSEEKIFSNSIIPNILNNAIKFTHEGGQIKVRTFNKENDQCVIAISDQGIGIPPETLNKIFDFAAKTSRLGTSGEKGTGFGLPIIKQLIDKSGGSIWIESIEETESITGSTTVFLSFKSKLKHQDTSLQQIAA